MATFEILVAIFWRSSEQRSPPPPNFSVAFHTLPSLRAHIYARAHLKNYATVDVSMFPGKTATRT